MATAYTALLGLALPVTGELSGTWGDTVNTAITALLDNAVAGTTTLSTDADVTLTTTSGAANTSRGAILLCSGARTVLRTITAPAQSKIYIVTNATTGGFGVKIVGVGPTTGVTIAAGESALLAWGGTDFIKISNTSGAATFTNLSVTGTTTLSGLTASTALALDASKNVVSVATTGSGSVVLSTSPTLITPALGTPTALVGTNITGTAAAFNINGTVGATTPATVSATTITSNGNVTVNQGMFEVAQTGANAVSRMSPGTAIFSNLQMRGIGNSLAQGLDLLAGGQAAYYSSEEHLFRNAAQAVNFGRFSSTGLAVTGALSYTTTLTGGTGVVNLGPGQVYKDASGNVGIGTTTPGAKLDVNGAALIQGLTVGRGGGGVDGNTAAGAGALANNTTGSGNTASGYAALYSNTTGSNNTASGLNALYSNTTGGSNTANGFQALYSNTTGNNNFASGQQALYSNTTGVNNTASGVNALYSNTTGNYNTASGLNALRANTTGSSNAAIGQDALYSNTTGNNNTASGVSALYSNTTGIANAASGFTALYSNTTGSANTASGIYALYYNTTGNHNTASGYQALNYNTTGSSNTASGRDALYSNTTGSNNTASGMYALYSNTTGSSNTASGMYALYANTTGNNNTASGHQALFLNTTGISNTAIGQAALYSNTTGGANTASGFYALVSNTTGSANTASGMYALYYNTTGYNNTASGYQALYSNTTGINNTASGVNALNSNTTGYNNTASGVNALYYNTTGNLNTASGYEALFYNTTGVKNTASGMQALLRNTTGSNNTASGFYALVSNTTGIQNTANGLSALYSNTTGSNNSASGFQALYNNTDGIQNTASGVNALYSNTTGSGNTAINPNTSAGGYAPVFDPTTQNDRLCMGSTGVTNAYVQVAWTVVSDARDKTDFAPVPHGLAFVTQLQPTAYRYKMNRADTVGHGPLRYGFKAQEVLALEGDTPVIVDAEDADKLRFNDQAMLAVLVNAIKELKAEFDLYKSTHP